MTDHHVQHVTHLLLTFLTYDHGSQRQVGLLRNHIYFTSNVSLNKTNVIMSF